MELFEEIMADTLAEIILDHLRHDNHASLKQHIEGICYKTLEKIRNIVQDDSLDDVQCFMKIEEIICALEEIGSSGGNRHDFG